MADNNSSNNRRNVTGSYKGVTGSYKKPDAYPKYTPAQEEQTVVFNPAKHEQVKNTAPKENTMAFNKQSPPVKKTESATKPQKRTERIRKQASENEKSQKFDWKLLFSKDNMKGFWKQVRYYGIILIVSLILTSGIVSVGNDVFAFVKDDESIIVTIPENSSTKQIAKALDKAGVIKHPTVFQLYCKLKKAEGKFQFGDYYLNANYSYDVIISKLKKSSTAAETVTFTVPEGATQDDIAELLTSGKYANVIDLERALNSYKFEDFDFVDDIPERRCRLEGYLPAGEYELYKGESAVSIVTKMLTRFQETVLTEQNLPKIKATGKTLDQLVTTASLVQAECTAKADYKKVASVFANRLSSPTDNYLKLTSSINYILPEQKKVLSSDDKMSDSPYNTYLYAGLIPGPVCTPSAEAFDAVLTPDASSYLYFISDGEKTTFSTTLEEHQAALAKAPETVKGTDTIK